MQLYTGVYLDYGLTEIAKENANLNIVAYNPTGLDNIQANGTSGNRKIVQESRYFSAGVQVKLGFMLNKNKPEPVQPKEEVVTKTEAPVQETPPVQQKVVETPPAQKELTPTERTYVEKPLAFQEVGNTNVTPELATRLDEIAKILKSNKNTDLNITGYTCDIGTEARNLEIGMKRAQAAADYLIKRGIQPDRIHLFSKGENDPLVPNFPASNRPLNRRVSIFILDKK